MPFKSKAQQRYMFAAEAGGDLPKGTAKKWADHTPNIKRLPERVNKKAEAKKDSREMGEHPDLPPDSDPMKSPWTMGVERDGISKTGFVHGFRKTAAYTSGTFPGTTDAALNRYNSGIMNKLKRGAQAVAPKPVGTSLAQQATKVFGRVATK